MQLLVNLPLWFHYTPLYPHSPIHQCCQVDEQYMNHEIVEISIFQFKEYVGHEESKNGGGKSHDERYIQIDSFYRCQMSNSEEYSQQKRHRSYTHFILMQLCHENNEHELLQKHIDRFYKYKISVNLYKRSRAMLHQLKRCSQISVANPVGQ